MTYVPINALLDKSVQILIVSESPVACPEPCFGFIIPF
jgi:hypothetical protein